MTEENKQSAFNDFTTFFEPLELPYNGITYTIPLVNAELGAFLKLIAEEAAKVMKVVDRNEELLKEARASGQKDPELEELPEISIDLPKKYRDKETHELMLGDQLIRKMRKDGVPHTFMVHAGMTAYHDFVFGREAAKEYWNSGGDPKAVARSLPAMNIFTTSMDAESTTQ